MHRSGSPTLDPTIALSQELPWVYGYRACRRDIFATNSPALVGLRDRMTDGRYDLRGGCSIGLYLAMADCPSVDSRGG